MPSPQRLSKIYLKTQRLISPTKLEEPVNRIAKPTVFSERCSFQRDCLCFHCWLAWGIEVDPPMLRGKHSRGTIGAIIMTVWLHNVSDVPSLYLVYRRDTISLMKRYCPLSCGLQVVLPQSPELNGSQDSAWPLERL